MLPNTSYSFSHQKKISAQNKKETDKLSKLLLNVQNIMTFCLVSLFAIK